MYKLVTMIVLSSLLVLLMYFLKWMEVGLVDRLIAGNGNRFLIMFACSVPGLFIFSHLSERARKKTRLARFYYWIFMAFVAVATATSVLIVLSGKPQ